MSHYASHSKRELTEKMKKAYITRSQKVKIKNQQNKKAILDKKLIFEYNGSHVHANPNWPKDKLDSWKHAFNKENAYVNIENYNKKIKAAENKGFKVFVIWDEDPNPENIIESILKKEKC